MSDIPSPAVELRAARREAKDLLAAVRAGDAAARGRLHRPHEPVRLSDAQHAVARAHGYRTWLALVRDAESFDPADLDGVPWDRIATVTIVCQPHAGEVMLYRAQGKWLVPRGVRRPGEDVWDDSVLRIPLETMGFRRQATHAFALDVRRRRVAFWVDGAPYTGLRPHNADAETVSLPVLEAAARLAEQGDGSLARLVVAADEDRRAMTYERHQRDLQRTLTGSYLRSATLAGGSGFGGDETDWRDARAPLAVALDGLLGAVGRPGGPVGFLDVGCANGHLGASMVAWGAERGVDVQPYGVDLAPELVERAKQLHPQWRDRFWVGDALDWQHPDGERFDLVHVLLDVLPDDRHARALTNLLAATTPGGRLLVSSYDTRSERSAEALVTALGHQVAGRTPVGYRRRNGQPYGQPSVWLTAPTG